MNVEQVNDPAELGGREAVFSSFPPPFSPLDGFSMCPQQELSKRAHDLGLPAFYFVAAQIFRTSFLSHLHLDFRGATVYW